MSSRKHLHLDQTVRILIQWIRSPQLTQTHHFFLTVILLIPPDIWVYFDHTIQPWDQAYYADQTLRMTSTFSEGFLQGIKHAINPIAERTPGLAWLAMPFAPIGLLTTNPMHGVQLFTLLIYHLNLYILANYLSSNGISAAATILTLILATSGSLFIGLGQTFFVEPLLLLILLTTLFFSSLNRFSLITRFLVLFIGMLASFLVKASGPSYLLIPALRMIFIHRRQLNTFFAPSLLRANVLLQPLLIVLLITCVWSAQFLPQVLARVAFSTSGQIAILYASGLHTTYLSKLLYWVISCILAFFSYPTFLCTAIGAVSLAITPKVLFKLSPPQLSDLVITSLMQIGLGLAIFATADNEDTRILYGLLPSVVLIYSVVVQYSRLSLLLRLATIWQYIASYLYIFSFSTSAPPSIAYIRQNTTPPITIEQINQLIRITCNKQARLYYNIIGVDYPHLNANTILSYATYAAWPQLPSCTYTSLGYAATDTRTGLDRLETFRPRYVIFPTVFQHLDSDPFNSISRQVLAFIETSEHYHRIDAYSTSLVIYEALDRYE